METFEFSKRLRVRGEQNNQANSATEQSVESLGIKHESLILAQNERWRRA